MMDKEKVLTCLHCGFYPVDVNGLYWSCPQCKELDDSFFEQIMIASKRVNKTENINEVLE